MTSQSAEPSTSSRPEAIRTNPATPVANVEQLRLAIFDRLDESDKKTEARFTASDEKGDLRQTLIINKLAEYGRRLNVVETDVGVLKTGGIATKPLWLIALSIGAGVGVHSTAMIALVYFAWTWHFGH